MTIKTELFRYQKKGVRKIWHFDGRALLADEMGLGKTLQALAFGAEAKAFPIIVICPATLKWNWEREAWTHLGLRSHVLEGRSPPKGFKIRHPVIIVNYDILGPWMTVLRSARAGLLICDECHKLCSRTTKQTKNTKRIARRAERVVCISGTPLLNRPSELFPTLNILRPDLFPSFFSFATRYCRPELRPWGWEYKGAENLAELHRLMNRSCMIRRLKSDVLSELPAKTRNVIPLDIVNRKEYDHAVHDFIGWLTKKSASLARRAAKAERLVQMGYMKRLAAKLKLPAVLSWIDDFLASTDEKLIVFGVHKSILTTIQQRYAKSSVLVDGRVKGKHRQHAVDQFNKDPHCRLFVGNLRAAGVGWSCTSASATAFVELGWTPGEHTQAEDRTHGLKRGQDGQVSQSFYLVARSTIEEKLCGLLQDKQANLEAIMDGGGVGDDLNIFDQLTNILLKETKPTLRR